MIDWAHAESLAFAAILSDGIPIRMTGQDTERGTFSQRHLVLHNPESGARFVPLVHLPSAKHRLPSTTARSRKKPHWVSSMATAFRRRDDW